MELLQHAVKLSAVVGGALVTVAGLQALSPPPEAARSSAPVAHHVAILERVPAQFAGEGAPVFFTLEVVMADAAGARELRRKDDAVRAAVAGAAAVEHPAGISSAAGFDAFADRLEDAIDDAVDADVEDVAILAFHTR